MRLVSKFLILGLLSSIAPVTWATATLDGIKILGLSEDDPTEVLMIENVRIALSLTDMLGKHVGESRLEYLINTAHDEARESLEPFGYYSAQITVALQRTGNIEKEDHATVVVTVDKGSPVRVRQSNVGISGAATDDRYLQDDLKAFTPQQGQVFDHREYELSKLRIVRRLAERGYFDADFDQRQVQVTRAEYAADIDLTWLSGIRYDMGRVNFKQNYFKADLFDSLVYWKQGSYFHQGKLDRLRESLAGLDYFSSIDIQTDPDSAVDGQVPVNIRLTLAKRNIYTFGLSYGTESGAGVRLGLERRYVNSRGHKLLSSLDYAVNKKDFLTQYKVPAFRWLDGWYTAAVRAYDEQTDYIDTRRFGLIGSRSGEINDRWSVLASVHFQRERWTYAIDDARGDRIYNYSTLLYPEISGLYVGVDDRIFPRKGINGSVTLRAGIAGAGSDTSFVQLRTSARWYHGININSRLLVHGEVGTTLTGDVVDMPPSLRYFAGGDGSVRGYAYREVGPRLPNNYALGARHVISGSIEYEHYLANSPWGGAVFIDSGSAFDNQPYFDTGVGIGLRWKSPVGPVRVDVARGLNDPDSPFQIYLSIGTGQ